jgi:hypothetical protein
MTESSTPQGREVCLLIGRGGAVLWADASDDPAALPDSRARWEAIWSHREELEIIAHSHPVGPAAFSAEDESTMAAIDSALGRAMRYAVVAPHVTIVRVAPPGALPDVRGSQLSERPGSGYLVPEPWWAGLIRLASGMPAAKKEESP